MRGLKGYKQEEVYGEVSIDFIIELRERLRREVDPDYDICYWGGKFIIRRGKQGKPFITTSINKLKDFVERRVLDGR